MNRIRTGILTKSIKLRLYSSVLLLFILVSGSLLAYSSFNGNFEEVIPQKVYRSAQPTDEQLRHWAEQYGIRTIINLRGDDEEEVEDEEATAKELGIEMISMNISSRRLTARFLLIELIEAIETAEMPILIHCHSGIDRTGTASAFAAMAIGDIDYEKAKWQAYVAPGPWKRKKFDNRKYPDYYCHISDVLRLYERYCSDNNLRTGNWGQLKQWILDTNELPETEPY
jgi:protein tyrosine phosphatase (PTP) superfamily phosphohydrolase (DUF442 family)